MKKRTVLVFIFFLFLYSLANANPPDVNYAGFAFSGNYKDIPVNFKYSNSIFNSTKDQGGRSIFEKEFYKFFQSNKSSIRNFNLWIDQKSDTKISMAVALTRENVSVVNIDNVYKVVVNICCNVIFLDFSDMKVVASCPLYLEYIDARKEAPSDAYVVELLQRLYFSEDFSILSILRERLGNIVLKNTSRLSLKIMNVEIEDLAKDKLDVYKNNLDAYKSILAQKFSDLLSSKLNVAVLPYAKDYLGAKMALAFSDARTVEFTIPPSSYGIDLTLRKLTKETYKEGVGEDAFLFGSYGTVKVYDPDLGTQYLEKKIKYGAVKNIPKLQKTTDDFSIYDEMTGLLMLEGIKELQSDKPFYKEVIERCLNK
jgi:hypothetical protein